MNENITMEKRSEFASKLVDLLPHGSGIDCDWEYDVPKTSKTVRMSNAYHCMDEHGSYCGYADFTLIVDCDFYGFRLQFNGRDSRNLAYKYGLREYLEDQFDWFLNDSQEYGDVIFNR